MLLLNSTYGRAFKAIRDDEIAAEAMGINLARHKQLAFCISSFFAGVGGAHAGHVSELRAGQELQASAMTYEILLIVVIGGIGSVTGSCLSSFLFVACSEWWLRFLDQKQMIGTWEVPLLRNGFRLVVFSIIIMIVVLFFRQGIMGDQGTAQISSVQKNAERGRGEMSNGVKTILELENVTMQFGGVVAVDNLSMDVDKGEIVALIGPNGAGKTTAFNVRHRRIRSPPTAM